MSARRVGGCGSLIRVWPLRGGGFHLGDGDHPKGGGALDRAAGRRRTRNPLGHVLVGSVASGVVVSGIQSRHAPFVRLTRDPRAPRCHVEGSREWPPSAAHPIGGCRSACRSRCRSWGAPYATAVTVAASWPMRTFRTVEAYQRTPAWAVGMSSSVWPSTTRLERLALLGRALVGTVVPVVPGQQSFSGGSVKWAI